MGGIEEQPGKEGRRLHSEKHACPRRGNPTAVKAVLSRRQTERGGKAFCDAEQSDHHLARCWDARIASQPLLKRQPIMRPLRPGQRRRWERWSGRKPRFYPHLQVLVTKQLHTRPSMLPPAPILPEDGERSDDQWMQEYTHLARLRGGAAIPLTLVAQGTGTATADAGPIDDAQGSVSFSALFMRDQLLVSGTPQRPIGLESKVWA